jgi:diguanylate cyclase (GGDEF)-like protein
VLLEPTGRRAAELAAVAESAGVVLELVTDPTDPALVDADVVMVAAGVAEALGPMPPGAPPRWIVGDAKEAGRLAGAAVACGAVGVLLTPVAAGAIAAITAAESTAVETDLARARSLVAGSAIPTNEGDGLPSFAQAFAADDVIVWWRDGDAMTPHAARDAPDDGYRASVATAARIAAAAGATTITAMSATATPRSVIAAPLRAAPGEVAGLIAVITDRPRRFAGPERSDLRALATRLGRELGYIAGHRRLLAEEERLRAGSFHDPLTGALTRAAFDQTVATAVAAAARRSEPLTLCLLDIVGLRKINLAHGHRTGDEVLAQFAARVRATVRGNDSVGRFGGDELAVLLVNADLDNGKGVADKLIHRVTDAPFVVEGQHLTIPLRGVVTPVIQGERSGEAAFARAIAMLRNVGAGEVGAAIGDQPTVGGDADTTSEQAAAVTAGSTLGGVYLVRHELSRGAMGVVYRAEDLGLGRQVAIKVLRSDLGQDKELVSRFRAEAAMLASLHHKNLVQVYTLGEHAGDVYFVMELVEGQPLADVLRSEAERGEWLPNAVVSQITLEIADALDAMHAVGLIHRDVKPANILLDRERDRAVLVDVGVAMRAGDRREAAGTPGYSAPESFLEAVESTETDVYGLAATVYSMLCAVPPFGSGALMAVLSRQLHEKLKPPSTLRPTLSPAVDAVLAKALDPQPKKRWASAGTFAIALASALERLPKRPDPTPPPLPLPHDRGDSAAKVEEVMQPTASLVEPAVLPPAQRATTPGRVRAAHFRIAAKLIEHRAGGAAIRAIADAAPSLAGALARTLSPLGWESADLLVELIERAGKAGPADDLARNVGRATITATFARFFGANPSSLAVETVLRAAPAFWGRYHDWAQLGVISAGPGLVELSLDKRPGSQLMCTLVAGELEKVAELAGAQEVAVEHHRCACRGEGECAYRVQWTS